MIEKCRRRCVHGLLTVAVVPQSGGHLPYPRVQLRRRQFWGTPRVPVGPLVRLRMASRAPGGRSWRTLDAIRRAFSRPTLSSAPAPGRGLFAKR